MLRALLIRRYARRNPRLEMAGLQEGDPASTTCVGIPRDTEIRHSLSMSESFAAKMIEEPSAVHAGAPFTCCGSVGRRRASLPADDVSMMLDGNLPLVVRTKASSVPSGEKDGPQSLSNSVGVDKGRTLPSFTESRKIADVACGASATKAMVAPSGDQSNSPCFGPTRVE